MIPKTIASYRKSIKEVLLEDPYMSRDAKKNGGNEHTNEFSIKLLRGTKLKLYIIHMRNK